MREGASALRVSPFAPACDLPNAIRLESLSCAMQPAQTAVAAPRILQALRDVLRSNEGA